MSLSISLTLPGLAPTPGRISGPAERSDPGRRSPGGGSREGGRATSRKLSISMPARSSVNERRQAGVASVARNRLAEGSIL
eukprot:1194329-Prorocentrum_minimum.AAC.5